MDAVKNIAPRYICGFLNSERGGHLFFGVRDDGIIHGLELNLHERDKMRCAMDSTLLRFTPSVSSEVWFSAVIYF